MSWLNGVKTKQQMEREKREAEKRAFTREREQWRRSAACQKVAEVSPMVLRLLRDVGNFHWGWSFLGLRYRAEQVGDSEWQVLDGDQHGWRVYLRNDGTVEQPRWYFNVNPGGSTADTSSEELKRVLRKAVENGPGDFSPIDEDKY